MTRLSTTESTVDHTVDSTVPSTGESTRTRPDPTLKGTAPLRYAVPFSPPARSADGAIPLSREAFKYL